MSKWGTLLIKGLIAEKSAREVAKNRKKDGAWQNDPKEYAKRKAKAGKQMSEPVVTSQFKPIYQQAIREKQKAI